MTRVAIVGGGPAGCATALALHARGIEDVTVIEAGEYAEARIGESVPPDIHRLLAQLGVLDGFLAEGHEPCLGNGSSWGSDRVGYSDFIVSPHGPGWHLDRRRFETFLATQVARRGMRMLTAARFRAVERRTGGGFRLSIGERAGRTLRFDCDQVIDAGGIQALLASRLGANRRIVDGLLAVGAWLDMEEDASEICRLTLLEAVEYGWWYAARLPHRRVVVMVASDLATLRALRLDRIEEWRRRLAATTHLAPALGGLRWRGDRLKVVHAATSVLQPVVGPGWLAVGDAASCFDPISAQGIHKALGSAIAAAEVVAGGGVAGGADPSAAARRYARQMLRDFVAHLLARQQFYDMEQRWPQAPFWAARQRRVPAIRTTPGV